MKEELEEYLSEQELPNHKNGYTKKVLRSSLGKMPLQNTTR